ncbi:tumor necrosis factor receptor superfamily member 5-like [Sebastes fasciatus]|uniref:tumor necrosis factor receptor superfamily member 5-like n=1 Tax=Sebastes fasciatus TaxID=394691 RepID=UPI003D9F8BB7
MNPQRLSLAVICVLSIWTREYAADCGAGQEEVDGQCCDLCTPGEYMKELCAEQQTVCSPCKEGFFSDQHNMIDRCEECRSCHHEYAEKCTSTTNANCSCRDGFLCSNNLCSKCEENKCVIGEKLQRAESKPVLGLIKYSYHCEPQPSCPHNTYFDVKEDICKTRRDAFHRDGIDPVHVILGIGFVLLSLTLFVFLSYACIKNLRKLKADNMKNKPTEVLPVSTNASDFNLSKEESGLKLIMQDESKNSNSFGLLHLEEVDCTC